MPIERRKGRNKRCHVAPAMREQIVNHVGREPKAAFRGIGTERLRLVVVGERSDLVDEAMGEPGSQIIAQSKPRRRNARCGEQLSVRCGESVVEREQAPLRVGVRCVDGVALKS